MDRQRLSAFINAFDTDSNPMLCRLEREALDSDIPIIRHEMIAFLQVLLKMTKPGRVLEIGTATGFSALVMGTFTEPSCTITTIERDPKRIAIAREHFVASGMDSRITLLEGDAGELLPRLSAQQGQAGSYDLVFMDAAKGQYIRFLQDVKTLLCPGGVLLSDNVLQEGDLLETRYLVQRRNRTIYKRMREYLYALKHDPELVTSIFPLADGVALSIRQSGKEQE